MLTGRADLPTGFTASGPKPTDHPAMAAIVRSVTAGRNNLPPAVVLPDKIVHRTGRTVPGQFAGALGRANEPWFLEASPFSGVAYGAYPRCRCTTRTTNTIRPGKSSSCRT